MTPAWRSRVSTSASLVARAPVCDDAARAPAAERPALTATLEIQEDDVGPRILRPVLNEVVARDVRLVPDRREARDPEIEPADVVQDRQTERAALRGEGDAAGRRIHRRERRVQVEGGIRVDDPHAVRPDHPDSGVADAVDERRFHDAAGSPALGEPGADDDERLHAFRDALVDNARDARGGHHDDGQVDLERHRRHRPIRRDAVDRRRVRMHGHERPAESGLAEVPQDLGSDSSALAVRTDDRDDARLEERPHGGRSSEPRPLRRALRVLRRRLERQRHVEHAVLQLLGDREPRIEEDVHHAPVLTEHVGVEGRQPVVAADLGQPLQHARADAAPLLGVRDRERHLGALRYPLAPVVPGNGRQRASRVPDEHELPIEVHVRELRRLVEVDSRNGHEPVVEALLGHPLEQLEQPPVIVGPHGTETQRPPVAKDDVGFILRWIGDGKHGVTSGARSRPGQWRRVGARTGPEDRCPPESRHTGIVAVRPAENGGTIAAVLPARTGC
jgi:hypothetical protein